MSHAFYDSPTFPWPLEEAQALHRVLYTNVPKAGQIDQIRNACGGTVRPVAAGAADEMWRDTLNAIAVAGCLLALDKYLRAQGWPHIHRALDLVIEAAGRALDLGVGLEVTVNRNKLRTALRQISPESSTKQVLVVRGEPHSGKSWTRNVVLQLARSRDQGCTYLGEGLVTNVGEVLALIFAELEGDVPLRDSTEEAWFKKAAADMLKLASRRKRGTWIVMDDLGLDADGAPLLDQQIRFFFDQLAVSMKNPAFAKWFRLVLIAYPDGALPDRWKQCAIEDRTAVADMHAGAVAQYLSAWALGKRKALTEAEADQFASEIVARATGGTGTIDPLVHLQRVNDELTTITGSL